MPSLQLVGCALLALVCVSPDMDVDDDSTEAGVEAAFADMAPLRFVDVSLAVGCLMSGAKMIQTPVAGSCLRTPLVSLVGLEAQHPVLVDPRQ